MDEYKNKKIYRVADLVERLDRNKTTLLRWEADGKIPKARRDTRGWRFYPPEDFDFIVRTVEEHLYFHPVRSKTPSASAVPPLAERTSNGVHDDRPRSSPLAPFRTQNDNLEEARLGAVAVKSPRPRVASSGWAWKFWSLFVLAGLLTVLPYAPAEAALSLSVEPGRATVIHFKIELPHFLTNAFRASRSYLVAAPPASSRQLIVLPFDPREVKLELAAVLRANDLPRLLTPPRLESGFPPVSHTFTPVRDAVFADTFRTLRSRLAVLPSLPSFPRPEITFEPAEVRAYINAAVKPFLNNLNLFSSKSEDELAAIHVPRALREAFPAEPQRERALAVAPPSVQEPRVIIQREIIREVPAPAQPAAPSVPVSSALSSLETRLSKAITDIANLYSSNGSKVNYTSFASSQGINKLDELKVDSGLTIVPGMFQYPPVP